MIDLRRRPEILFAPIVVLFLLANFTTIGDPIAFQGWLPVASFFFLT